MKYHLNVNDHSYEIEIKREGVVLVNGEERVVDFKSMGEHAIFSLIIDHQSFEAVVEVRDGKYHVMMAGDLYEVDITDDRMLRLAKGRGVSADPTGEVGVKAPMPGLIVKVPVEVGQDVKKGQTVVILESMKMENELKSPRDGTVARIEVTAGQTVEQNKTLVVVS